MKKLIIPAFALALAAGAPSIVFAQDDHHDDKAKTHVQGGQGDGAKPMKEDTPKAPKAPKVHRATTTDKSSHDDERDRTRDLNRNGVKTDTTNKTENNWSAGSKQNDTDNRGRGDNNKHDDNNNNNNHDNNGHNDRDDHGHNAGGVHVNINIGSYRKTVSASRHFRIGVYRAPAHYSYRRWGIGERLPNEYYARDYWLTDFSAYDLVAPPDGYVWVRFGPDALLIDEDSGEVIQVVYGVFI